MRKDGRSWVFSPWRRLGGNLIAVFQYLKGSYKEDRGCVFTRSHMAKIRVDKYRFHWEKFHLDIRNDCFLQ